MHVIFSVVSTGCGNNGGTQSVIRMSNCLQKLGHNVKIISTCKNYFTWEPTEVEHIIVKEKDINNWPKSDVIISTGVHSIRSAIRYSRHTGSKHWSWLRGWERWQMKESDLIGLYAHENVHLMANSEWLMEHVSNHTRKMCKLQYSGIPIERFENRSIVVGVDRIGGLAHFTKPTKRWDLFTKLAQSMRYKGIKNVEFCVMGDRQLGDNSLINEYHCQPSFEDKVHFYNSINIWIATSELEGLHIPPMEAGLCGSAIVVPNKRESGTFDYSLNGYSCYRYEPGNVDDLEKWVMHLMLDEKKRYEMSLNLQGIIKNKIGNVKTNAERMERILEND